MSKQVVYFDDSSGFIPRSVLSTPDFEWRIIPEDQLIAQARKGISFNPASDGSAIPLDENAAVHAAPFCDNILIAAEQHAACLLYYARLTLLKPEGKLLWYNPAAAGNSFDLNNPARSDNLMALLIADSSAFAGRADCIQAVELGFKKSTCISPVDNDGKWSSFLNIKQEPEISRRRLKKISSQLGTIQAEKDASLFAFTQWQATARALGTCLDKDIKRLVVYGAGKHTRDMIDLLESYPIRITGITDDNWTAIKPSDFPWPAVNPETCDKATADAVLISSHAHEPEMWTRRKQFTDNGLSVHRIYND